MCATCANRRAAVSRSLLCYTTPSPSAPVGAQVAVHNIVQEIMPAKLDENRVGIDYF